MGLACCPDRTAAAAGTWLEPTITAPAARPPAGQAAAGEEEPEDSEGNPSAAAEAGSYDYLLSMPINSLTLEKVQALQQEAEETRGEVERLRATTEKQMWSDDLDAFLQARLLWCIFFWYRLCVALGACGELQASGTSGAGCLGVRQLRRRLAGRSTAQRAAAWRGQLHNLKAVPWWQMHALLCSR